MSKITHRIYIWVMVLIVVITVLYLSLGGYSYYTLPLEERFYHPLYKWFKPSGFFGHGLGIVGTLMILFGVLIYIARKRYGFLEHYIRLKYLLEFHIFLCILGPVLILFHTTFKFGGVVSVAFWSMTAVVLSGIVGRFIYIQIPRTIEGRALSLDEVKNNRAGLLEKLKSIENIDSAITGLIMRDNEDGRGGYFERKKRLSNIKSELKKSGIERKNRQLIIDMVKQEFSLAGKIGRLQLMQKLFKYWHVAHLPFAIIMLVIVVIHVIITLSLGYQWIF